MVQVSVSEAQSQLPDLINAVLQGESVLIDQDEFHQIQLVPVKRERPKAQFGCAKGMIEMADDFDEPIDDFNPYMQ